MKIEEISAVLKSIAIQSVDLNVQLLKSDLIFLISESLKRELPKVEKLPKGIELDLVELKEVSFQKDTIIVIAIIRVLSEKAFTPDSSDLRMNLSIPLRLHQGYLQLNKPAINLEAVESGWKQKLFQSIINKILDWNDQKLVNLIDKNVNQKLANPDQWEAIIQSKLQSHSDLNPDYRISSLNGSDTKETIGLNTIFDLAINYDLRSKKLKDGIQAELAKKILIDLLLKKINGDIQDKIEQEVEIISLDILEENQLIAKGRAGVMNIQKEFELIGKLLFDPSSRQLKLLVEDITVQGGFLIQKGFSLVEPSIRKKIESAVQFNLEKLLLNLNIPIKIPALDRKYKAKFNSIDLNHLSIKSQEENLLLDINYDCCSINIQSVIAEK